MYSVSNIISGIIMVIMIISFRDKTNTDYSDETDDKRKIFNYQFSIFNLLRFPQRLHDRPDLRR